MKSEKITNDENWKINDIRILIIDKLLSKGWTSYLDMCIAINEDSRIIDKFKTVSSVTLPQRCKYEYIVKYYTAVMVNFQSSIKSTDMPHMVEVWALVNKGVDIEGIMEGKKKGQSKDSDSQLREDLKKLFIETHDFDIDKEGELQKYPISKDSLSYLKNCKNKGQNIRIFRYVNQGYSILEDLKAYYKNLEKPAKALRNISTGFNINGDERFKIIPDPDVMGRMMRLEEIKKMQADLLQDAKNAVHRRLEKIESLKETKPDGWMKDTSKTYLNAIYDSNGVFQDPDLGAIIHKYGLYLLETKEYAQGQSFLNEGLAMLKKDLLNGDNKSKEEYALILQNLSTIHTQLGDLQMAEKEAYESLDVFYSLFEEDNQYQYGVAVLKNTLAGIHFRMRKFDAIEEEYKDSIDIFSRLVEDDEPQKYLYMLIESITSLACYHSFIGRYKESVESYEEAMPYLELLVQKNYDDFAPQMVTAKINFSNVLQDIGEFDRAEEQLSEAGHIINRLEERFPGVYKEDLSTVFNNLGTLYVKKQGASQKAIEVLKKAEGIRRELADNDPNAYNERLAETLFVLSVIDNLSDDIPSAIKKIKESLSLMDIYGQDDGSEIVSKVGKYYYHLGVCYIGIPELEKALLYFENAERIFKPLFNKNSIPRQCEDLYALTLMYLGNIYGGLYDNSEEESDVAERKYEESMDVALWYSACSPNCDKSCLVSISAFYGCYLLQFDRFEEAKQMFEQAILWGESVDENPIFERDVQAVLALAQDGLDMVMGMLEDPEHDDCNEQEFVENEDVEGDFGQGYTCEESAQYTREEALSGIQCALDKIDGLDPNALDYRKNCYQIFRDSITFVYSLKYCMSIEDGLSIADYLSSFCKYLYNGCDYESVIVHGELAINNYERALKKDNGNWLLRLKYINMLSFFCGSLDKCGQENRLSEVLGKALEILVPIDVDPENDIANTYAALKGEVMFDCLIKDSSEDGYGVCQRIIEYYQNVAEPKTAMMCRFLLKAASTAGNLEKWEEAESLIEGAESLMAGCDENDLENLLQLGELYTLKGRYIHLTPLKWPDNYEAYPPSKSLDAFDIAEQVLLKGIGRNPALFGEKLLDLYRTKLDFLKFAIPLSSKDVTRLCEHINYLIDKLCKINEFSFSWSAVLAKMEMEKVLFEIKSQDYQSGDMSDKDFKNIIRESILKYGEMETMLEIYKKRYPKLYVAFTSKIFEAKRELMNEMPLRPMGWAGFHKGI